MATLTVTIDSNDDAMSEDAPAETARVLRRIAEHIEQGRERGRVFDVNGNTIGSFAFAPLA